MSGQPVQVGASIAQAPEGRAKQPAASPGTGSASAATVVGVADRNVVDMGATGGSHMPSTNTSQQAINVESAVKHFFTIYSEFDASAVRKAMEAVWSNYPPGSAVDLPGRVEEAFNILCMDQFGVEIVPPDAIESDIQNMRMAMLESQRTYELEKIACEEGKKTETEMTAAELAEQFLGSELVPALKSAGVWEAFVGIETRPMATKVLDYEKKCRRWWPNERGVSGYFADVSQRAINALSAPSSTTGPAREGSCERGSEPATPSSGTNGASTSGRKDAAQIADPPSSKSCKRRNSCESARTSVKKRCCGGLGAFLQEQIDEIEDKILGQTQHLVPEHFLKFRPEGCSHNAHTIVDIIDLDDD